jgi:hypothetical protein
LFAPEQALDAENWIVSLKGMTTAQERIVTAGGWTQGASSLMAVLNLTRNEVANCRVIRWLLDPLARHGLGANFLAALAVEIELELSERGRAISKAEVSRANSRADVVVSSARGDWTVVIEAKVDAAEGDRQAARLEEDWPEAGRLVFLATDGVRLPWTATDRNRWRTASWR